MITTKKFIAINCNGHKKGINKSEPPRILYLIHIHVTRASHVSSYINLLRMKFSENPKWYYNDLPNNLKHIVT